ncbi:MAG: hypothetical protein U5O39_13205 [Gammaproteobacteria bacterium]|nr:hypothetical protein [Gammaproteobacteria bacterium]
MSDLTITVEDDPVPIVKVMAAKFRRAARHQEFMAAAGAIDGTIALRSASDPQELTITVKRGAIHLKRGVDKAAAATITVDFDTSDVKRVSGWWRHPLIIYRASKLLAEYPPDWQDAARQFWSAASELPDMPRGMLLRCTDDGSELILGEDEAEVEVEAPARQLSAVFGGEAIFADATMKRRVRAAASMKHLAVLSEASKLNLLGEL